MHGARAVPAAVTCALANTALATTASLHSISAAFASTTLPRG